MRSTRVVSRTSAIFAAAADWKKVRLGPAFNHFLTGSKGKNWGGKRGRGEVWCSGGDLQPFGVFV